LFQDQIGPIRKFSFTVFAQISIVAPGLLGASVAQAVHERKLAEKIVLWARRPEARLELEGQPWCTATRTTPEEACAEADLVVICAPVANIIPLVRQIHSHLKPSAIVTDVGSVKSQICRFGHDLMPTGPFFVGSHPMAGSEKTGMAHARADLFENRPCFVTPLPGSREQATESVVRFWHAIGARVVTVEPEEHDEIVAHISHLPHLLASTLCSFLQLKNPGWRNFAGNGLRDTTRVASGSAGLWREILEENRDEVLRALRQFQTELEAVQAAIANGDFFEVENYLARGKDYRDRIPPA
jgi:cyclohexadieny/prephenate dehydrogenase